MTYTIIDPHDSTAAEYLQDADFPQAAAEAFAVGYFAPQMTRYFPSLLVDGERLTVAVEPVD